MGNSKKIIKFIGALLLISIYLFPVIYAISSSFKTLEEIFSNTFSLIPNNPTLEAWILLLTQYPLAMINLRNSFLYSLIITFIATTFAYPAAYAISRFRFKARTPITLTIYFLMVTPSTVFAFPLFLEAVITGLHNTPQGYILIMSALLTPFACWLLKPAIDAMPIEIEESALIDGASTFSIFLKIVLPLTINQLGAVAFFVFTAAFNDFAMAFVMLNDNEIRTFPLLLQTALGFVEFEHSWNLIMAIATLGIVPSVALFIVFQKRFQEILIAGAVKR
jgi:N,N'-diacetylchitobiose transport system permease protein